MCNRVQIPTIRSRISLFFATIIFAALCCCSDSFKICYPKFGSSKSSRKSVSKLFAVDGKGVVTTTSADVRTPPSGETNLNLDISIASTGFLNNIFEYGKARMARRAVGILSKMPAYKELPKQPHYTAAIWACEQGQSYDLAISVFEEMKSQNINRVAKTYEALIGVAEKTGHWKEAIEFFHEMETEKIEGTTEAYNACIWAAEQGGRYDLAIEFLQKMEDNRVARNSATYAACAYACERAGEGTVAMHIIDLMREEGQELTTPVYQAAIWACTKAGLWTKALDLFNAMESLEIFRDEECYCGAIWACSSGGDYDKAVELLKLMKFVKLERNTKAFDGALTALSNAGKWEACLDMITWMDRDNVWKSPVTYKVIIEACDAAGQDIPANDMYLRSLRDGFYATWVKGTRLADFRGYSLPLAKVAVRNILHTMKSGKLPLFNLHIAVCDAPVLEWTASSEGGGGVGGEQQQVVNTEPSFSVEEFNKYLLGMDPVGTLTSSRMKLEGLDRLVLPRESLMNWTGQHPV